MSHFDRSRSGTRPQRNHQVGDPSASPPTDDADAALPLPRHLLVALAGIAADVTSLRAHTVDDPQLHDPLEKILGKLDGLVDSIYEGAAHTHARAVDVSSEHGSVIVAEHLAAALAVPAINGEHRGR